MTKRKKKYMLLLPKWLVWTALTEVNDRLCVENFGINDMGSFFARGGQIFRI